MVNLSSFNHFLSSKTDFQQLIFISKLFPCQIVFARGSPRSVAGKLGHMTETTHAHTLSDSDMALVGQSSCDNFRREKGIFLHFL